MAAIRIATRVIVTTSGSRYAVVDVLTTATLYAIVPGVGLARACSLRLTSG